MFSKAPVSLFTTILLLSALVEALPSAHELEGRDSANRSKNLFPDEFYEKVYGFAPTLDFLSPLSYEEVKLWVDDISLWEPPQYLQEKFPFYLAGYDYDDVPVWVFKFGRYRYALVAKPGTKANEDFHKFSHFVTFHILLSMSPLNATRKDVSSIICILDDDGIDLMVLKDPATRTFGTKFAIQFVEFMTTVIEKIIVINATYLTEMGIHMLRPILGKLLEKFEVYGTNPSKWVPVLRRTLPDASIPTEYGGSTNYIGPVKTFS